MGTQVAGRGDLVRPETIGMMPEQDVRRERYVALGDSYTIGEGVAEHDRWPNVLISQLRQEGISIDLVANPSVTGWTTCDLIEHELPILEKSDPTFATLLIGVNDWVQGVPEDAFCENVVHILDRMQATLLEPDKLLVVTIPDFSVTREGGKYARGRNIAAGIATFNSVIASEADRRTLPLVDIFPLSQQLSGPEYVSPDGLHPSAAAYARWVELIYPLARDMLLRP